jgi:hypothetical protein
MPDSIVTKAVVSRIAQTLGVTGALEDFIEKLSRSEPALYNLLEEQRVDLNRLLVAHHIPATARQEIEKRLMLMTSMVSKVWTSSLADLWSECEPLAAWAGRETGGGK